MRKWANIWPYMTKPLVIYDFAPDLFWISIYMRKILFNFLLVYNVHSKLYIYSKIRTLCKNFSQMIHIKSQILIGFKDTLPRRKIRLIEGNAKCRHLKKLSCKGTLRQVFICRRPRTTYPPPAQCTHTVYVYKVDLFTQGRGEGGEGGESWTREKERGATVHKVGSKIPTWLQSLNSDKHLPQSPFIAQFF